MKRSIPWLLAAALLLSLAACGDGSGTAGGSAATMRLKRTEGTVGVADGAGSALEPAPELGLYDGYGVDTETQSYAWIGLDTVKLVKLDENSAIGIHKEGKALEVEVLSGSLFFNVTEPLAGDETMNIRASSMIVGIRGTCGWVTLSEDGGVFTVYLLEGAVECSNGEHTATVSAREKGVIPASGEIVVSPFSRFSMPDFVQTEIDSDAVLAGAIEAAWEKQITVSVIPTGITADSVINFDGYGSLAVNGEWGQVGSGDMVHMGYTVPPQTALIDRSGEFVFPYLDTESRYFYTDGVVSLFDRSTSVFLSLLETEPEAAHGYFGIDGTRLLQMDEMADADFAELHPFGDGVAFVRLCGEFDSYGQTVYEGADGSNHVIGSAGYGKKCITSYLIDRQGNVLFTFPEEFSHIWDWEFDTHIHTSGVGYSSEGLIPVTSLYRFGGHVSDILNPEIIHTDMSSETWACGFMDHSGNMVIPQIYSAAGNFSEGLAAVCGSDGLWGYIDKAGAPVIPFEYDGAGSFADGLAPVSKSGKTGYINAQNEVVIPFAYEDGFGAGGGVCAAAKNGKYGLIDYNGNEVLPFEYDDISTCAGGVVYAVKDRQVYVITVTQ